MIEKAFSLYLLQQSFNNIYIKTKNINDLSILSKDIIEYNKYLKNVSPYISNFFYQELNTTNIFKLHNIDKLQKMNLKINPSNFIFQYKYKDDNVRKYLSNEINKLDYNVYKNIDGIYILFLHKITKITNNYFIFLVDNTVVGYNIMHIIKQNNPILYNIIIKYVNEKNIEYFFGILTFNQEKVNYKAEYILNSIINLKEIDFKFIIKIFYEKEFDSELWRKPSINTEYFSEFIPLHSLNIKNWIGFNYFTFNDNKIFLNSSFLKRNLEFKIIQDRIFNKFLCSSSKLCFTIDNIYPLIFNFHQDDDNFLKTVYIEGDNIKFFNNNYNFLALIENYNNKFLILSKIFKNKNIENNYFLINDKFIHKNHVIDYFIYINLISFIDENKILKIIKENKEKDDKNRLLWFIRYNDKIFSYFINTQILNTLLYIKDIENKKYYNLILFTLIDFKREYYDNNKIIDKGFFGIEN